MTVKELMEALAEHDPEAIVYAYIPQRYLKPIFYEASFTIEEVVDGEPKRVNLFPFEPNIDCDNLNSWPESFRPEYVLQEEREDGW
ncbi:hypothetical protein [Microcoleus sp. OTE_8_concoct_300]|uniref:hypothetical protein n=1 Tax=Microcoleus sp. OTE_8_concoct_300 TaxID=2964710 RepID=UPI00403F851B